MYNGMETSKTYKRKYNRIESSRAINQYKYSWTYTGSIRLGSTQVWLDC